MLAFDMFRIWGGGIEEKTEFYEYCDQQGILLWQEFPFACTNYPRDTRYLKIARQECNTIVHRTRNHPSVAVYCGGNEFNPYINAHICFDGQTISEKIRAGSALFKCESVFG